MIDPSFVKGQCWTRGAGGLQSSFWWTLTRTQDSDVIDSDLDSEVGTRGLGPESLSESSKIKVGGLIAKLNQILFRICIHLYFDWQYLKLENHVKPTSTRCEKRWQIFFIIKMIVKWPWFNITIFRPSVDLLLYVKWTFWIQHILFNSRFTRLLETYRFCQTIQLSCSQNTVYSQLSII